MRTYLTIFWIVCALLAGINYGMHIKQKELDENQKLYRLYWRYKSSGHIGCGQAKEANIAIDWMHSQIQKDSNGEYVYWLEPATNICHE